MNPFGQELRKILTQCKTSGVVSYQMGCGILSDLRLFQQSERLHRLTAAIPLGACSEQEWLDAAQYLTGHDCASALEARNRLVR